MYDHLSLLQLYSEWGVNESLTTSCTNHLENSPSIPTIPNTKRQSVSNNIIVKTNQHPVSLANNLNEIKHSILNFKDCSLHDTAMHSVLPLGNPKASIYIIGDVPDADEDRSGEVFSGTANFWLKQMLESIDLSLEACFRMPLIPWRPPGGRQLAKNEIDICLPFLYKTIQIYKPKYILTLGQLPIRVLLQTQLSLRQLKSRWHSLIHSTLDPAPQIFPLPHLSQININAKIRQATWKDLLQIRATLEKNL